MLEWVSIPFFRGSSWPRDWTWVSCIAGRFFTIWALGKPSCADILSSSLLEEIFSRFFWTVLVWTGGLLNLLPSCHLDIFLQLHPPCVFFFFSSSFPYVESPFSWNTHRYLSWFISSFLVCIFGIPHSQCLLRRGCGNQNKGLRHCGLNNMLILPPQLEDC